MLPETVAQVGRAFGDFEADLKRSDSEPIPDRKERFLAFICSLNTFQSKNPTYTLSNLDFQPDEKRGKRIQKSEEERGKTRSEIESLEIYQNLFWMVCSVRNCFLWPANDSLPFRSDQTPKRTRENSENPKLWEIAEHAISISYGKLRSMP